MSKLSQGDGEFIRLQVALDRIDSHVWLKRDPRLTQALPREGQSQKARSP